jgi:polar amino acid transport system permease protein
MWTMQDIVFYILAGANTTLRIFVVTLVFAIPLGIVFAIGKIAGGKLIKGLLDIYTWLLRGTPLMLQIFFVFYGIPQLFGITLDRNLAAYIAFVINYAAYFTEIFRAGILSIEKGQFEASKALGMSYPQTMWRIIIPQAVKRVLPPVGNEFITLIKDTSLVMVIAIPDIMRNTKEIVSREASPATFIIAALIYLILTYGIVYIFSKTEKKLSYYD